MSRPWIRGVRAPFALAAIAALSACVGHPRPKGASDIYLPAVQMRATDHPAAALHLEAMADRALLSSQAIRARGSVCDLPEFADARPDPDAPLRYLILSGGSLNGAFGAGFFLGLAEAGQLPPEPTFVTGISTGSLQATFLFLGQGHRPPPDRVYDWSGGPGAAPVGTASGGAAPAGAAEDQGLRPGQSNYEDLALAYTIRRERDLLKVAPFGGLGMVLQGSKGKLDPLGARLLALISPQTVRDVAFEACRGRKLYVGVADVDDGQAYAIDLTHLAQMAFEPRPDGRTDAGWRQRHMLQVRRAYVAALIASSSVPVGAQPVTLLLEAANAKPGEQRIRHLFVDGGARFGVFLDDIQRDQAESRLASDAYGVTLLVNTRLTLPPWRADDDPLRPNRTWRLATLGLRTVDILENQVYRLSVEAVESAAARYGGLHMAYLHNENLGPGNGDDGREWPDDHVFRGQSCARWHEDNARTQHPAQFYPDYMACLIDYGRQRGRQGLWNLVRKP